MMFCIGFTVVQHRSDQYSQAFDSNLLTSICSNFFLMVDRSQLLIKPSFLSAAFPPPEIAMNFTAAQFSLAMSYTGQLALCFMRILGTYNLSSDYEKQGCFNASEAEMRNSGYLCSILLRRSISIIRRPLPLEGRGQNSPPDREISHSRFKAMISCAVFPIKRCLPKMRQQKMHPTLKTSEIGCDFVDKSLMFMISGATYPGVPHRTKRQLGSSATVARPKSIIVGYLERMTLSGLRSRWITFLRESSVIPRRMPLRMNLRSFWKDLETELNLVQMGGPSTNSMAKYMEFSDSQTPSNFIRFGWLNIRVILIQLMSASFPFSWEKVASFPKALIATLFWDLRWTPRYTMAKLPFPRRFQALKRS